MNLDSNLNLQLIRNHLQKKYKDNLFLNLKVKNFSSLNNKISNSRNIRVMMIIRRILFMKKTLIWKNLVIICILYLMKVVFMMTWLHLNNRYMSINLFWLNLIQSKFQVFMKMNLKKISKSNNKNKSKKKKF